MALMLGTGTWITLIVLGALLVWILKKMGQPKSESMMAAGISQDLANLTVRDARRGDVLTIARAGENFDDLSFTVDKIHRYEWGRTQWMELAGKTPKGSVYLEWEDSDKLSIYLTKPGETLRLESLGITEDDLMRMDEEQSSNNTVRLHGETFRYGTSHETGFFEDESGEGEGFYLWDFASSDGRRCVSVEKWEGESFEVFLSDVIDPDDLTVYRK